MSYRTISFCLLLAVFSCDYIDDPIQASIGPVDPCELPKMQFKGDSTFRKVLIEDFTGHRCNNCPKASDAIKAIEQNQAGAIVAVAVHAGPANFIDPDPPNYPTDFRTPEGDDLEEYFKVTFLPAGMVSRTDFNAQASQLKIFTGWASEVATLSSEAAPCAIDLELAYDGQSRQICGQARTRFFSDRSDPLNISLWLTESKIIAPQKMPDNSANPSYEHNHVFRTSLNSAFGQSLQTGNTLAGDVYTTDFSMTLDTGYVRTNCHLVAFVTNTATEEVLQVTEVNLSEL